MIGNSSDLFDEQQDIPIFAEQRTRQPIENIRPRISPPKSFHQPDMPANDGSEHGKPSGPPKPYNAASGAPPEFGKASPLRNPLKKEDKYAHLFNQPKSNAPRPEHHRPGAHVPFQPPHIGQPSSAFTSPVILGAPGHQNNIGTSSNPIVLDSVLQSRHHVAQPLKNQASGTSSGQVPIARPFNIPTVPTYQSAPSYSTSAWQPVNSHAQFARHTNGIDLAERDDEDQFDPNAALQEQSKFGEPDPYMYVESNQANENIKALLEGAFEDEEDKPRMRLRKRKPQETKDVSKIGSLADKLKALEVKVEDVQKTESEPDTADEEEDGSVEGLNVKLLPHQVEGVSWMLDKEIGQRKKNGVLPKGGILADDMGLGKTIQSLALILQNPRPSEEELSKDKKRKIQPSVGKATLIVAPLALIKQWEGEIRTKVTDDHALRVLVHHGQSRTKTPETLKKYDVVITTYQTLSSEHAGSSDTDKGPKIGCMGVNWYRIILDEAHTIKNRNAKMSQAAYALNAHYRWCLTGTPMQNNLDELQSLIKFLRIKPYNELSSWKTQIIEPMKNGRGGLAMKRLQYFLKAFMKRRTKDVLKKEGALNPGGKSENGKATEGFKIVAREVQLVECAFDAKERAFYERLQSRVESRLEEIMGGEKTDYVGALVLLLRLRQACNHWELSTYSLKKDKDALTTEAESKFQSETQMPKKTAAEIDDLADLLGGMSVQQKRTCDLCSFELSKEESSSGAIRCSECEESIESLRSGKNEKTRKDKSDRRDKKANNTTFEDKLERDRKPGLMKRRRRVVVDSDDESEGEWIVGEEDRKVENLGKAGDTDDENADGAGEWLHSDDTNTDEENQDKEEGTTDNSKEKKDHKSEEDEKGESDDSMLYPTASATNKRKKKILKPSTKIRELIKLLHKETPEHKVIVFSEFTSMLDIIEPFLRDENFRFCRYDGSMRNDVREASLNQLRTDKNTRILLCSLKCGSLGLNLTAASRVVILEPFWNPVSHYLPVQCLLSPIIIIKLSLWKNKPSIAFIVSTRPTTSASTASPFPIRSKNVSLSCKKQSVALPLLP
jgi:SNF2 family DNA or RNA helicase